MAKELQFHPFAESFDMLKGKEWEEFKESVKRTKGIDTNPILYRMKDGEMEGLDGRQRYKACRELKIKPKLKRVAVKDEDVADFISQVNIHRRHLTKEGRAERVAALRKAGLSMREIGSRVGASVATIKSDIDKAGGQVGGPEGVRGRDGRTYRARKPKKGARAETNGEREPGQDEAEPKVKPRVGRQVFDWTAYERLFSPVARVPDIIAGAYEGEKGSKEHKGAINLLDKFATLMNTWRRRLTTKKPEPAPA